MSQIQLLGIKIDNFSKKTFYEKVVYLLENESKKVMSKINTEFLLRALKDQQFKKTLNLSDINISDGIGVLWTAKYLSLPLANNRFLVSVQATWQCFYSLMAVILYPKYIKSPIPERIPGVDCMYLMLEAAIETSSPVYFFGAEKEVLGRAIEIINNKYPGLKIAGYHDGYNYLDQEVIDDINRSKPGLLIVALGSPKQEYWIRDNIDKLTTVKVAVGEGGSLDFVAGSFKRAPKWMQNSGLEWLWRLFANKSKTQTGRRVQRVWRAVPVFMYEAVRYKIRNNGQNNNKT